MYESRRRFYKATMRDFCSLDTCVHINRPVTDKVLTTGYVLNRRILMRINSPLRLCHVCGPLMDPAHLLCVNFKTHALKGRVVDTEDGISRSVENTERKRKALGRERVTATQRPIGRSIFYFYLSYFNVLNFFLMKWSWMWVWWGYIAIKRHRPIRSDSC